MGNVNVLKKNVKTKNVRDIEKSKIHGNYGKLEHDFRKRMSSYKGELLFKTNDSMGSVEQLEHFLQSVNDWSIEKLKKEPLKHDLYLKNDLYTIVKNPKKDVHLVTCIIRYSLRLCKYEVEVIIHSDSLLNDNKLEFKVPDNWNNIIERNENEKNKGVYYYEMINENLRND